LLPNRFGESRIDEHHLGCGRNEVVEQHVLGSHVPANTRSCDYVLRGSNGIALVSRAARPVRWAGFTWSAARTAVAGRVASNSAEHIACALLDEAEQQASEGNE
jgi:hypothetical protein